VCTNCWGQIQSVDDLIFDNGSAIDRLVAVGAYDGAFKDIIHALKYQGRRSIALGLAALMRTRAPHLLSNADVVVPVPLHWRREYARGFNQAREIAKHLRRPVLDALVRTRATRPQVELSKDQRQENVRGVFAVKRRWWARPPLAGLKVVVIDDVSTTGATLSACAAVLRNAGAAEVSGLTAARKI
jgi:ComF family protein